MNTLIPIGTINRIDINSKNINKYDLDDCDSLVISGPMGSGKTKQIKNLVKKYNNIIFVTFRVTLINQLSEIFSEFTKYSEIENKIIDLNLYNKVITTIDSVHRIVGECDLLIIDEYTYTMTHLVDYVKEREMVYSTLIQYLNSKDTKVLAIDALIEEEDIKYLTYFKEKINYINYNYPFHKNKKIYNYQNNLGLFFNKIKEDLNNNKRIVICANSKTHILFFEELIKKNFPDKRTFSVTSDNADNFIIDEWDTSDVILYSPSITAGISYEKNRFDTCYGFFINISATAEMSIQQLFRVRNLNTNEIHICTHYIGKTDYDLELDKIKDMILKRDKCVIDGLPGIKVNCIKNEIIEDDYFYLFCLVKKRNYISRNKYNNRLMELLKKQGIDNFTNVNGDSKSNINSDYKGFMKILKDNIYDTIANSEDIDYIEADELRNTKNITKNDYYKLKKYTYKDFYMIDNINKEIIKTFDKKKTIFNNLVEIYANKDNLTSFINNKINDIHNENANKHNTIRLHINKKYERLALLLFFIEECGFVNIFDKNKITVDDNIIINFYKKYEELFNILFNANKLGVNSLGLKEVLRYMNSRLRTVFGISLKKDNKNNYEIKGLDLWEKYDNINYYKEEIINRYKIKMEMKENNKELEDIIKEIMNLN